MVKITKYYLKICSMISNEYIYPLHGYPFIIPSIIRILFIMNTIMRGTPLGDANYLIKTNMVVSGSWYSTTGYKNIKFTILIIPYVCTIDRNYGNKVMTIDQSDAVTW